MIEKGVCIPNNITIPDLINNLQAVGLTFQNTRQEIIDKGFDKTKDVQATIYGQIIDVINNTGLSLALVRHTLFDDANLSVSGWKKVTGRDYGDDQKNKYLKNFDQHLRTCFVFMVHFSVDHSFRLLLRSLDEGACNRSTGNFCNIYQCLSKKLNIRDKTEKNNLMDLWTTVRNSLHNNGIHYPINMQDKSIIYAKQNYSFIFGKKVDFITWDFIINLLLKDLKKTIDEIIFSRQILEKNLK